MTQPRDLHSASVAHRFLQLLLRDERAGRRRSLADYQQQFPEQRELIAREYAALVGEEPSSLPVDAVHHPALGSRYRERVTIGRGGMGTVLRVLDPTLEREVAMKLLGQSADELPSASVLARFLDEAKLTGQLQHPGIVAVHEIGIDADGRPYFTMPLIQGRSLYEIITSASADEVQWSQVRLIDVLARVCEAVAFAHERGVVHRDLKPANVMVGRFGEIYVVDWGVARVKDKQDRRDIRIRPVEMATDAVADANSLERLIGDERTFSELQTMEGDVIGTPAYMAPEQARGEIDRVDARSDVYSIGAMLYHLLAGSAPFATDLEPLNGRETLARLLLGPPTPLSKRASTVAAELVAICERAMARDADQRYQTAAELGSELRAYLENRVVRAHSTGPVAELKKWVVRNRGVALASAIALVALVVGFAVSLTQKLAADHNARSSEANAVLAQENLDLAFEAGEELLASTGLYDIENEAGSDPVRRELLQKALEYYKRFQELRGDDPRVAEKVALSHFRIALLEGYLSHAERARAAFAAAHEAYTRLLAHSGPDDRLLQKLVNIETELHIGRLQSGDLEGAIAGLREVRAATAELLARNPHVQGLLRDMSSILHNLAMGLLATGRGDEALQWSEDKLRICRQFLDAAPDQPLALAQLGSALHLRAMVHWRGGRLAEAEAGYRAAVEHLETALREHPRHRGLRFRLAESLNPLAVVLSQMQQPEASRQMLTRAAELLRELVAAHPGVRSYHGHLASTLGNLGITYSKESEYGQATALLDEALREVRRALKLDPDATDFVAYRRSIGEELAVVLILDGKYVEGATAVRELAQEVPDGTEWTAGRLLAACGKACAHDALLTADQRSRMVESFGDEAMHFLKAAADLNRVAPGALDRTVFDLLRPRADFQALAERTRR